MYRVPLKGRLNPEGSESVRRNGLNGPEGLEGSGLRNSLDGPEGSENVRNGLNAPELSKKYGLSLNIHI